MVEKAKRRSSPTMSQERANEILDIIQYDTKTLQLELNRILGTNYQYRDVWKWLNLTSPPLTAQLFLLMKLEEADRIATLRQEIIATLAKQ